MPAPVIAAIIAAGAGVGSAVVATKGAKGAAKTSADASKEAGDIQAKSAEDALAFQKQVYAERQKQLAPYIGSGQAAEMKMADLLGLTPVPQSTPSSAPTPASTPAPAVAPDPTNGLRANLFGRATDARTTTQTTPAPAAAQPAQADAGTVMIQAPTGEQKAVPAGLVDFYVGKGAKVVNAGATA